MSARRRTRPLSSERTPTSEITPGVRKAPTRLLPSGVRNARDMEPRAVWLSAVVGVAGKACTEARFAAWNWCSQAIQSCQAASSGLPNTRLNCTE